MATLFLQPDALFSMPAAAPAAAPGSALGHQELAPLTMASIEEFHRELQLSDGAALAPIASSTTSSSTGSRSPLAVVGHGRDDGGRAPDLLLGLGGAGLFDPVMDLDLGLDLAGMDQTADPSPGSVFAFPELDGVAAATPGGSSSASDEDSGHASDDTSGSVSPGMGALAAAVAAEERAQSKGRTARRRAGKVTVRHSKAAAITAQEREMLEAEGIELPVDMPLTKAEERDVKRIRRKIKNKLSAQDSRRRKKEYVSGLEERVEKCTRINMGLKRKVTDLETQNTTLLQQLRDLRRLVARRAGAGVTSTAGKSTGTALMLLALSFSLMWNPASNMAHPGPAGAATGSPAFHSRTLKGEAPPAGSAPFSLFEALASLSPLDGVHGRQANKGGPSTAGNDDLDFSAFERLAAEAARAAGVDEGSLPATRKRRRDEDDETDTAGEEHEQEGLAHNATDGTSSSDAAADAEAAPEPSPSVALAGHRQKRARACKSDANSPCSASH